MNYQDIVFNDTPTNLNKLTRQIEEWAIDRDLDKGDTSKQIIKIYEEAGELARSYIRGDKKQMEDDYGDIFITIAISAMQNGLDIRDCISKAYQEISGRDGKIKDGVFVKESDLA
ncbi:MazG-like family protein [Virgibacillus siamensis]|uniref:MazG-like family protein n=1 Tax=Virgibacillus siamensis TaxID=480071 RepID=UPI0009843BAF|nr:MazG-like family protein [Virgibacillus siamensis]